MTAAFYGKSQQAFLSTQGTDIDVVYIRYGVRSLGKSYFISNPTGTNFAPTFFGIDLDPKTREKYKKQFEVLSAQYNRAKAQKDKHLEKELFLKIEELRKWLI